MKDYCEICPRHCLKTPERTGYCGTDKILVAHYGIHRYEEPIISGSKGSGTIFFGGCNLRCCFCQNSDISHVAAGEEYSPERLAELMVKLAKTGVHNINLVTAAHIRPLIATALTMVKPLLTIPVVYNSSGYEGDISDLDGLIDVYLPDFKYINSATAALLSKAPDYPEVAKRIIRQMVQSQSETIIEDGLIKKGVIIRHLVLPTKKEESIAILTYIKENFPSTKVSIMSQYTPSFNKGPSFLNRKITSLEYNAVINKAVELEIDGYMQDRVSASAFYTPDFGQKPINLT